MADAWKSKKQGGGLKRGWRRGRSGKPIRSGKSSKKKPSKKTPAKRKPKPKPKPKKKARKTPRSSRGRRR